MFLTVTETMRLRHVRYCPEDLQVHSAVPSRSRVHLQAGVSGFWNDAFKIMSTIPALGVIVIHIIEVFTVSQSIVLMVCFVVMLGGISLATMNWLNKSEHEEGDGTESALSFGSICPSRVVRHQVHVVHVTCPVSSGRNAR